MKSVLYDHDESNNIKYLETNKKRKYLMSINIIWMLISKIYTHHIC